MIRFPDMQSLTVNNPAPPKVAVQATEGAGSLSIAITPVQDLDGHVVWVSPNPGFNPATLAPIYRGTSPLVVHTPTGVGNWYVQAAAVYLFQLRDHLDLANLNLSRGRLHRRSQGPRPLRSSTAAVAPYACGESRLVGPGGCADVCVARHRADANE